MGNLKENEEMAVEFQNDASLYAFSAENLTILWILYQNAIYKFIYLPLFPYFCIQPSNNSMIAKPPQKTTGKLKGRCKFYTVINLSQWQ